MLRRVLFVSLLSLSALSLSACGQKGPLYLPAKAPVPAPATLAEPAPAPAQEIAPTPAPANDQAETAGKDKNKTVTAPLKPASSTQTPR